MRLHLVFLAALLLLVPSDAHFQPLLQSHDDAPLKLSAQLVVLDAEVLSKKTGVVIGGLRGEDFAIYEDGIKQQITHFSQDKLPLSIVLLLDVSVSVRPVIQRVCDEGLAALAQLKTKDEVAVMMFGKWATVLQDFTTDRQLVARMIGEIKNIGPWIQERTYIHDAVFEAASHLAKSSNPVSRRAIIIITDNQSNQPEGIGHSQAEANQNLLRSGVAMFGLIVGDFEAEVRKYKAKGWLLSDSIGGYVVETGGISMQIDRADAVAKLASVIERLRTRYSFGYTPKNEKRDGGFRKISLKISREVERREGGVTIITRTGYYAPGQ